MTGRSSFQDALYAVGVSTLALSASLALSRVGGTAAALLPFFPAMLALAQRQGAVPAAACGVLGVLAWAVAPMIFDHHPGIHARLTGSDFWVLGAFAVSAGLTVFFCRRQQSQPEPQAGSGTNEETLRKLSHELRTPLSAIIGWAQVLRAQGPPEQMERGLEVIERNARAQTRILETVLEGRVPNSGKQQAGGAERAPAQRERRRGEHEVDSQTDADAHS